MTMEKMKPEERQKIIETIVDSNDKSALIVLQLCNEVYIEGEYFLFIFRDGNNVNYYRWNVNNGWLNFPIEEFVEFTWNLMNSNHEAESIISIQNSSANKNEQIK